MEKLTRRSLLGAGAALVLPGVAAASSTKVELDGASVVAGLKKDIGGIIGSETILFTDFGYASVHAHLPRRHNVEAFLDGLLVKHCLEANAFAGYVITNHPDHSDVLARMTGRVQVLFKNREAREDHLREFGTLGLSNPEAAAPHPETDVWTAWSGWGGRSSRKLFDITVDGSPFEDWNYADAIRGFVSNWAGGGRTYHPGRVSIRFKDEAARRLYVEKYGSRGLAI